MSSRSARSGRKARLAQRAAPPQVNPAPPGAVGGAYRPLSEADVKYIYATALRLLDRLGMGEVPDRLRADLLQQSQENASLRDQVHQLEESLEDVRAQSEELEYQHKADLKKLKEVSRVDGLTKVWNRHYFLHVGRRLVREAHEREAHLSCLMLDIDHFKSINDRFGHLVGDRVLVEVARRVRTAIGNLDLVGRYGGEEFAVMLPAVPSGRAEELAQHVRRAVGGSPIYTTGDPLTITVSVGVSSMVEGMDLTTMLGEADAALYQAKRGGRDRVCVAGAWRRTKAPEHDLREESGPGWTEISMVIPSDSRM